MALCCAWLTGPRGRVWVGGRYRPRRDSGGGRRTGTGPRGALRAVRAAYEGDDADAARQALLEWGRQTWPDDAPTNLTRLAGRLEGPAKQAVLCLDQALYSPNPVAWADVAAWEYLRAMKT